MISSILRGCFPLIVTCTGTRSNRMLIREPEPVTPSKSTVTSTTMCRARKPFELPMAKARRCFFTAVQARMSRSCCSVSGQQRLSASLSSTEINVPESDFPSCACRIRASSSLSSSLRIFHAPYMMSAASSMASMISSSISSPPASQCVYSIMYACEVSISH